MFKVTVVQSQPLRSLFEERSGGIGRHGVVSKACRRRDKLRSAGCKVTIRVGES